MHPYKFHVIPKQAFVPFVVLCFHYMTFGLEVVLFNLKIPTNRYILSFFQIEKNQDLDCVDVRGMLIEMRSYRMGLIQTPDQLRFSYLAIIEGGKQLLNMSDANSNVRDSMHGQFSVHQNDKSQLSYKHKCHQSQTKSKL